MTETLTLVIAPWMAVLWLVMVKLCLVLLLRDLLPRVRDWQAMPVAGWVMAVAVFGPVGLAAYVHHMRQAGVPLRGLPAVPGLG